MNGRGYDPKLGRFLSVDPFIQSPTNTQSVNPYTYIFNNPLSGVDPTGYSSEEVNAINNGDKETVTLKAGDKIVEKDGERYVDQGGDTLIKMESVSITSGDGNGNMSTTTMSMAGVGKGDSNVSGSSNRSTGGQNIGNEENSYWGEFKSTWNDRVGEITSAADNAVDYWVEKDNVIMGTLAATMTENNILTTTIVLTTGSAGGAKLGSIRQGYVNSMKTLEKFKARLLDKGYSTEGIARALVRARNQFKDAFRGKLKGIMRNYHRPTYRQLRESKTPSQIIERGFETNKGVNRMLGAK